jgi:hypothetical protein
VRLPAAAAATRAATGINPDPAFDYKGLLWDYRRMGLPQGWKTTAGSPKVTVGVADPGLDFTHRELAPKVKRVVDLTDLEDPPLCQTLFGLSDADPAAQFGRPRPTGTGTAPGPAATSPPPSTAPASTGSPPRSTGCR